MSRLADAGARLGRALLTVVGVVLVTALLVRAVPGDPVDAILGDAASPADRAALRIALRLDRPAHEQILGFGRDVLAGTLGTSFRRPDRTVSSLIGEVIGDTAALALAALAFAWSLAVPLGTIAARRRGSAWDRLASRVGTAGVALPTIALGPALLVVFGVWLRWLPLPGDDARGWRALILPAFTAGFALAAILTRQTRAAMAEVLAEPYVVAARARGLGEVAVLVRHALRNAILPVATIGAAQLGALLSGAVVTERVFERRGLGTLFVNAFFDRDIPVVQGCVLVFATVYVATNLAIDVLQRWLDPRIGAAR